jgi:hypothetical protein
MFRQVKGEKLYIILLLYIDDILVVVMREELEFLREVLIK